jgi:Flp pilus assembly protein TadG
MRKLDQRGFAALDFCYVAVVFFTFVFAIFDLGRYVITMQSLRTLANAGARATMIKCYTPAVTGLVPNTLPSSCTAIASYLTPTQMQNAAPFLYQGGLTPTMTTTAGGSALTVAASQPGFTVLMPIWGTTLNAPSASTQIPF